MARQIIIIAHDMRSTHNVGSLLRTAEGLAIQKVYLTGYTPYPKTADDERLPHLANKLDAQIHKTALGAESSQAWQHTTDIFTVLAELKQQGFTVAALEQTAQATPLPDYAPPAKLALVVGREVDGLEPEIILHTDVQLEIPMFGRKESFNVVQAAAMALYHCVFMKP